MEEDRGGWRMRMENVPSARCLEHANVPKGTVADILQLILILILLFNQLYSV